MSVSIVDTICNHIDDLPNSRIFSKSTTFYPSEASAQAIVDGKMDDLYFYTDGIIVRREVDSNFDLNIDIWVYIKDGNLIEKYEQDLDFNGDIDKVKIFGEEEQS